MRQKLIKLLVFLGLLNAPELRVENMVIRAIKEIAKRTFLYRMIRRICEEQTIRDWRQRGKPIPPPHVVKQRTVKEYAKRFSIGTLIETGTYQGDMVEATRSTFGQIFSIELDQTLYEQAKSRFASFSHISIIHGDSGEVLSDILAHMTQPCLFWLDGHYSGGITAKGKQETPIRQELAQILDHSIPEYVILIDDAWCFTGQNDYPTLLELRDLTFKRHPGWVFEVKDDIIRVHPIRIPTARAKHDSYG